MTTYVISDIHGRLDLLRGCLAAIEAHGTGGTVIFTGDFIDRGPDSKGVVDLLMEGPGGDNWRWSFVRGNHEDMALQCHDGTDLDWWCGNGGVQTLRSYGGKVDVVHLEWFDSLPRLTWDKHRVYVHAGLDNHLPLDRQKEETTQWKRYRPGETSGHQGRHIVHGHTPVEEPELHDGRTNLDTGGFATGRMVVGVFDDDKPGGPIDLLEVRA